MHTPQHRAAPPAAPPPAPPDAQDDAAAKAAMLANGSDPEQERQSIARMQAANERLQAAAAAAPPQPDEFGLERVSEIGKVTVTSDGRVGSTVSVFAWGDDVEPTVEQLEEHRAAVAEFKQRRSTRKLAFERRARAFKRARRQHAGPRLRPRIRTRRTRQAHRRTSGTRAGPDSDSAPEDPAGEPPAGPAAKRPARYTFGVLTREERGA